MARVVLENVRKVYPNGHEAVHGASFSVEDGEFVVFVGPSGCGKSTMLRMIAGLEAVTDGSLTIGERVVADGGRGFDLPPKDRDVAMVFQNYALYPHMSVYDNMAFGLKVRKFPKSTIAERVSEAARILGLEPVLDRKPGQLSGGQRQRVAVGRAIVRKPAVFLFDEPLSNLDAKLRMDMRAELKRLHVETGATVIYVTHDQLEALTMSTHIAMMSGGVLQQFAPPLDLYAQPANLFAADFLGNPRINFLSGVVERVGAGFVARCGGLTVPLDGVTDLDHGNSVTVGLRAEEFGFVSAEGAVPFAEAEVTASLPTGTDWFYRVRYGDTEVTVRDNDHPNLEPGSTVNLAAFPNPIKVFGDSGRLAAISSVPNPQPTSATQAEPSLSS